MPIDEDTGVRRVQLKCPLVTQAATVGKSCPWPAVAAGGARTERIATRDPRWSGADGDAVALHHRTDQTEEEGGEENSDE